MKQTAKEKKELLFCQKKSAYKSLDNDIVDKAYDFCDDYKTFLNLAKTEREATDEIISLALQNGFSEFCDDKEYKAGDKIYKVNRGKSIVLAVIGSEDIKNGVNLTAAHIDSPRLDIKPNPLYEDTDIALLKTHYYGGIKKYQWTAIPLSLHGVIIKGDGECVKVRIGDEDGDPVFCVNDLLPHLADEQMKRSAKDLIKGEELNVIVGTRPFNQDEESEQVKLQILNILNEKYGIVERDFISAELEMVPAFPVSDVGFDRSLVGGYGQDDRVCAYTAVKAIFDCESPKKTAVTMLADKEETGSEGNTGMQSAFLEYFIEDLASCFGTTGRKVLSNSSCLSADVNASLDPTFADVHDKKNAALCGYGTCIAKYTGSRGKGGTSDASAEFVNKITRLLEKNGIQWQIGELGKVDGGGGGTVAMFLANLGMDVIDLGVPVLSMHAPFEVTAKIDVYESYRAILSFFKEA